MVSIEGGPLVGGIVPPIEPSVDRFPFSVEKSPFDQSAGVHPIFAARSRSDGGRGRDRRRLPKLSPPKTALEVAVEAGRGQSSFSQEGFALPSGLVPARRETVNPAPTPPPVTSPQTPDDRPDWLKEGDILLPEGGKTKGLGS